MIRSVFPSKIKKILCPLCRGELKPTYKGDSDLELTCVCKQLEVNFSLFFDVNLDVTLEMDSAILKVKLGENRICKFHQYYDEFCLEL